jgi:hypothetical protein
VVTEALSPLGNLIARVYSGIARSGVGDRTYAKLRTVHAARGLGDRLARQTLAAFQAALGGRGSVSRLLPPRNALLLFNGSLEKVTPVKLNHVP